MKITKRNDPCPRFSSADKGHFHSGLVSNIIFGYLHFCFLPFASTREPVKSCLLFLSFSNEKTVGFVCFLWAFRKRRGVNDSEPSDNTLAFIAWIWLYFRLASCSDPVVFRWSSLFKVGFLLCHWLVPPLLWLQYSILFPKLQYPKCTKLTKYFCL